VLRLSIYTPQKGRRVEKGLKPDQKVKAESQKTLTEVLESEKFY
jgi:hypothetical protein